MAGKHIRIWAAILIGMAAFIGSWRLLRVPERPAQLTVELEVVSRFTETWDLFYDDLHFTYGADRMVRTNSWPGTQVQRIAFPIPAGTARVQGIRIDPGPVEGTRLLKAIVLRGPYSELRLGPDSVVRWFSAVNDLSPLRVDTVQEAVPLRVRGADPYFASNRDLGALTQALIDERRPVLPPFLGGLAIGMLAALLVRLVRWPVFRMRSRAARTFTRYRAKRLALALLLGVLFGLLVQGIVDNISFTDRTVRIEFTVTAPRSDNFQVFHAKGPGGFGDGGYVNAPVAASDRPQVLSFRMPKDTAFSHIRFDPGNSQDSLLVHAMEFRCARQTVHFGPGELLALFQPNEQVRDLRQTPEGLAMRFTGDDPFLFCDEDLRSTLAKLQERAGNGPMPALFGLLAAVFMFLTALRLGPVVPDALQGNGAEWLLTVLFAALMAAPLLSEWLPILPHLPDTEKRKLADRPELRMHSLQEYPARYTAYFADHFGFRKPLFRWNSFLFSKLLHSSPVPDNMVFGKDGFMFLMREGVTDQYRGLPVFSEEELERIGERLERRRQRLAEQGISYYLMIAPMKATMYRDKMPERFRQVAGWSGIDQLREHLEAHTHVPFIDLREPLQEARTVRDTYYATDIHWNPWGAFAGYRTLMTRIAGDRPAVGVPCEAHDYVVRPDTNEHGDLAMVIALNDVYPRVTPMMEPVQPLRARRLAPEDLPGSGFFKDGPVFMSGPDQEAPRLLMFRDSFAVYLIPFLSEHFSRSVYVWTPIYNQDIVDHERPDIVVHELLEVFLRDLVEDRLHEPDE